MHRNYRTPTLGIVAISYNEEKDLPGFIEHLSPWVDEVIIVDDNSTDRTVSIARSASPTVQVLEHPMNDADGYGGQRNIGIAAASTDWILHMDIDERVPPELANEIRLEIQHTNLNAFAYRRRNFFLHRPMQAGGWENWNRPQLARRGYHRFHKRVHEVCLIEGAPNSIGQLQNYMWHLNDESYLERMEKSFRYCQEVARKLETRDYCVSWYDLSFRPLAKFLARFILRRGYKDGIPGLITALHSACAVFRAYTLVWDRQNKIPRELIEKQIREKWYQHIPPSF